MVELRIFGTLLLRSKKAQGAAVFVYFSGYTFPHGARSLVLVGISEILVVPGISCVCGGRIVSPAGKAWEIKATKPSQKQNVNREAVLLPLAGGGRHSPARFCWFSAGICSVPPHKPFPAGRADGDTALQGCIKVKLVQLQIVRFCHGSGAS